MIERKSISKEGDPPRDVKLSWEDGDEIIDVRLSKRDYVYLRKMIQREESVGWVMKWLMTVGLGFVGLIMTFSLFFEEFRGWLQHLAKGV